MASRAPQSLSARTPGVGPEDRAGAPVAAADGNISGLVITLGGLPGVDGAADAALARLAADGRLTLGPPQGVRVPAVLETAADAEAEAAYEWLRDLPGVVRVDVTFVHLAGG